MNKTRLKHLIPILALAGTLSAEVINFDGPEYTANSPLAGVAGWSESEPSPSDAPLSWVGSLNGSKAGAIGGWYNIPLASSSYSATLATSGSLASTVISFDFAISGPDLYPDLDQFSISVLDTTGGILAQVALTPLASSNPYSETFGWNVSYSVLGVSSVDTLVQVQAGQIYSMSLSFSSDSFELLFGNSLSSFSFTESGVAYDDATQSIGSLSFGWSKLAENLDFGDNYLVFDNISVIPEPATVTLLLAGAALLGSAFFRRHKGPSLRLKALL